MSFAFYRMSGKRNRDKGGGKGEGRVVMDVRENKSKVVYEGGFIPDVL